MVERSTSKMTAHELWANLVITREIIIKAREQEFKKFDIPTHQGNNIFLIHFLGDNATPSEIARHLFKEKHSTTEILNRMKKRGLVRRVHDLERKNMVRIVLTKKALTIYNRAMSHVENIMSVLSEEDRQEFLLYFKKLQEKGLEELKAMTATKKPEIPSYLIK